MIMTASEANRITTENITAQDNFLLSQEMYTIQREITKAIRKRRFNTQFAFLISVAATTQLTNAGYTVGTNDYGTYVSW